MTKEQKEPLSSGEIGKMLYYLVGSKTDEFLSDQEALEKAGLDHINRDDFYLEVTICNMFLIIRQYSRWETREERINPTLDTMHFLFLHQLKEHSQYEEEDLKQMHDDIFARYDQYSEAIALEMELPWLKTLVQEFLNHLSDDWEYEASQVASKALEKYFEKFYRGIPNLLNTFGNA